MPKAPRWQCTICGLISETPAPPRVCTKCGKDSSKFIKIK
jgi:rubrerythrin